MEDFTEASLLLLLMKTEIQSTHLICFDFVPWSAAFFLSSQDFILASESH